MTMGTRQVPSIFSPRSQERERMKGGAGAARRNNDAGSVLKEESVDSITYRSMSTDATVDTSEGLLDLEGMPLLTAELTSVNDTKDNVSSAAVLAFSKSAATAQHDAFGIDAQQARDEEGNSALWRALAMAGEAIDEEKRSLSEDILAAMPSGLLLEAARHCLVRKEELLCLLRSVYELFDRLSVELESHLEALPRTGSKMLERDAAISSLRSAQEVYDEAYEDLEEAVLKTQGKRAQRRGLDLEALRDDVAAKRCVAHQASKEVKQAMERLARVSLDFPEIRQHLRAGLPHELLDLWNPSRTMTFFDAYELLVTDSRHRVYRAVQGEGEGEEVFAIKEFVLESESAVITCMHEAALLCKLRHPSIAQVVAVFEDHSDPNWRAFFMQMPFYKYGHLWAWIDCYAPRARAVRSCLADVLNALVYLHDLGIAHCDVKPQNILIGADERARLADFDISVDLKTRVSARYAKQRSTTAVGYTVGYEAPELLQSGASPATDMFAFGQTLYGNCVKQACLAADAIDADEQQQQDPQMVGGAEGQVARLDAEKSPGGGGLQEVDGPREDACTLELLVSQLLSPDPAQRPCAATVLGNAFFASACEVSKELARTCCIMASERCLESKVCVRM
jgi:hypothetical protein